MKPWNVQWAIQDRVEKEAWEKWWKELPPEKLLQLKKIAVHKNKVGWLNFIISELRP